MPLFQQADYESRYGVTLDAGDIARWPSAYNYVESLVQGYISSRLGWPLDDPPDAVAYAGMDIMRLQMAAKQTQLTEHIKEASERATALLKDISAGRVSFSGTTAAPAEEATGFVVSHDDPLFPDDMLSAYQDMVTP